MGSVDSHTDLEVPGYILGMGKGWVQVDPWWVSAGVQQTPTLQAFSPANPALLHVQLQELGETCGKVGKGSVPEGIKVFQVLWS